MSKARLLDLNYGHLGRPVYDSENHEWRFPRVPRITRQFRPISEPYVALAPSSENSVRGIQNAVERQANIKGLQKVFPELQPAASSLPKLAYVSEAVIDVTSSHDPTVSELLAFGQVSHRTKHGNIEDIPIVAVAGGPAGEILRLILLTKEQLGWKGEKSVHLNGLSTQSGEESSWRANGSPIQQLEFSEPEAGTSSWLAVRYHGAVSILHPQLRLEDSASTTPSRAACHSRLHPNLVVTLYSQRPRRVPFTDVAFNPWNPKQIATIDQSGHWNIWLLQSIAPQRGLWTIKTGSGGFAYESDKSEEQPRDIEDGWGKVLWAGSHDRIIATSRQTLAVFDIRSNAIRFDVTSIVPRITTDWILDVKRSTPNKNNVFIVTSSALYWILVAASDDLEQPGAQCLLSWKHFIDPEDISLRLNVLHVSEELDNISDNAANTVLLYSCLSGLTMVFTLQDPKSSPAQAISTSDPFLLPIMDSLTRSDVGRFALPINSIAMRTISYGFLRNKPPFGLGQVYVENGIKFCQLSILSHDLSLSECLYAEAVADIDFDIHLPKIPSRKGLLKTPAKVLDDFIVPDGFEDEDPEECFHEINMQRPVELASWSRSKASYEGERSINFEWLCNSSYGTLAQAAVKATQNFDEVILLLYDTMTIKGTTADAVLETLLDLARSNVYISDLDKAESDFKDFLGGTPQLTPKDSDTTHFSATARVVASQILTPDSWKSLGLEADPQILNLYDTLIKSYISPLSRSVPSRIRVSVDKVLRDALGQLILASYAARPDSDEQNEDPTQDEASTAGTQFILPVRGRESATNSEKGKQPAARSSSSLASSQPSEAVGFLPRSSLRPLPTPEPTPSLHSQSSFSSLAEDPFSQRLQTYTSLATQAALPIKLSSNVLDHWQVGMDSATYEWEAVQQAFASDDEEKLETRAKHWARAKKRQKRHKEPTVRPSSQPTPKRVRGSQSPQVQRYTQGSSQTDIMGVASQVGPGRFDGRLPKGKKKKPTGRRPAGFK